MKVSDVINKLEAYENKFGDIDVTISDPTYGIIELDIDRILADDNSITIYLKENSYN